MRSLAHIASTLSLYSHINLRQRVLAAVVWGERALELLRPYGQALRLLRHDGRVFTLGGWPEEDEG